MTTRPEPRTRRALRRLADATDAAALFVILAAVCYIAGGLGF
jgi:hypothetical protein